MVRAQGRTDGKHYCVYICDLFSGQCSRRKRVNLVDIQSEQDIYRFGNRRFWHQRRLEVEDALGVLHHKCTTVARIAFDGHRTVQGIWVRSIQGESRGSIAIPEAVPLDREVLIHGR